MTGTQPASNAPDRGGANTESADVEEHFTPTGTVFILVLFVIALVLLWASVYVILLSRGVTT